ncbi:zinc finger and BTB domain-containing protein 21 isoform X1 [Perognathus longimembris pacificus]|uniref:zinc finger and BTB domain-containing protein 21 isoform X1 n=1 Tax=Perognathus longimembris pacificus TaxID=214514 RepID=UPI002018F8FF|nr:zinc finger and BTB domain-containing protein 21 isoform X1 [Perognathus longimembris pacificus]XP_048202156.1 zinc finger and BTB domain-containing protein 21 isoform X1 [Perognathus longimembris pacificus]XP_048202157.1 zinc finger and BTB domain-containing protein 21 isoform X1 [Perognathus longimembris pacificus]XP_048202158.1 zinc finger and BTB domain-containing protein 21 isoform X1 [Perognathus longimembris pacificus]XP_048202159.1 zinc finger and BTB domain-containing protein 21 iso
MEGLLHYINPAHAISLLSALNEERLKGQLCDVVLIVGDQKFRAHKNVLAASSEYFQSLFTNKENESQTVFQLDFCEPDAFDNVLNYIYSSSLFVEKGSLAAVQELGYSLGISFLTNIVSKAPQAPFPVCPNRRRVLVSEDDETSSQKRSVIVCQGRSEAPGKAGSQNAPDPSRAPRPTPSAATKTAAGRPHVAKAVEPLHSLALADKNWPREPAAGYTKALELSGSPDDPSRSSLVKRNAVLPSKPPSDRDTMDDKPGASSQLPKGKAIEMALKRPRPPVLSLRSSSETPFLLKESNKGGGQGEDRNLLYYSKLGLVIPSSGSASANQSIDRSGPLVKSLLRRSLSMDSQVPVYSPAIDLKSPQGSPAVSSSAPGNVFCALAQKSALKDCTEKPALEDRPQVLQPHRLRSFSASQPTDREGASPAAAAASEVRIKTEPSSPLSDPADIIRVTVGDGAAAARDPPVKTEEDSKDMSRLPAKRRFQADRRSPFKKARAEEQGPPVSGDSGEESTSPPALDGNFPDSDLNKEEFGELEGTRPNKKFKCKHCLKIFRSTAGLHRHANMYHNPEKPYACDICHKRFHTNFKVWTHCQTQHGVVKNPSPASSSHAVLDEKFQRKLIDIVREREIKKALVIKLRYSKPGFLGPGSCPTQQVIKRNLRSRAKGAHICAYCGKAYRFLSQFKQHIKMHPGERPLGVNKVAKPKERVPLTGAVESKEVYPCRLCNAKLSSLLEQGNHERLCRNTTVCPYCSLRFFSPALKQEHEDRCEYKKLTCLECMRTFKSSFSIWRHQVEVHNQNSMAPADHVSLPTRDHNGEVPAPPRPPPPPPPEPHKVNHTAAPKEDAAFSDSSEQVNFDSEDSACLPEDLSLSKQLKIHVKEEPAEEAEEDVPEASPAPKEAAPKEAGPSQEAGLWPCEKCGKMFTAHRQLERHQELLCSVKPFICHVCHKAFRTNFRLWSHFQSHMSQAAEEPAQKEAEACPVPTNSPSPPPLPPPPPLPKIQPLEPDSPTGLPENPIPSTEKLFTPQESDTLFYHAPPLSAITFKRQFMCKLCHRTFKTAFSLWSHEQTHN